MGEHGLWQKMSLFEESARVPLLIVAPGLTQPGGVAEAPVSQLDLFPTLAELCDVTPPGNLQGQSLVPMLADPRWQGRNWALTQVVRRQKGKQYFGYSLRTPRWRYTEWDEGRKGRELYDHKTDPQELVNLADVPANADSVQRLATELKAAVSSTFPADGKTPSVQLGEWDIILQE